MRGLVIILAMAAVLPVFVGASNTTEATVRILHLSDTHNLHNTIELKFPLPEADIVIHTGDFAEFGSDDELASANQWLGKLSARYKHVIVILGNHDWGCCQWPLGKSTVARKGPEFWRAKFSNAHLLWSETITVMGLKIFGSSWKGDQHLSNQQGFGNIPSGLDILLTHGPAYGILDFCANGGPWGSSKFLLHDIMSAKPKVHLFGHDHEQRGVWQRQAHQGQYVGGIEYHVGRGSKAEAFKTTGPPPFNYPVEVVSNNAMKNQPPLEWSKAGKIAGPPRIIIATKSHGEWHFHAEKYSGAENGMPTCGGINETSNERCKEKVLWAATMGKYDPKAPFWFRKMLGIAGVAHKEASQDDFQRLYFCSPPGGVSECILPPCSCSKPPCNSCTVG